MSKHKVCIITPYYQESRAWLERCVDSVRRQSHKADHILVADGFPQAWLDDAGVRHLRLDRAHGDYGNVGRGLAAMMAINENYDAIAFVDADKWCADDHVELCLATAAANREAPYVVARRDYVRLDESVMPLAFVEDAPQGDHVDTNCYLLLRPTFPLLHYWVTIPRQFSAVGDRLFRLILKSRLPAPAIAPRPTIKYTCLFEGLYRALGEPPPPGAKPGVDWRPALDWMRGLSPDLRAHVDQLAGLNLSALLREAA